MLAYAGMAHTVYNEQRLLGPSRDLRVVWKVRVLTMWMLFKCLLVPIHGRLPKSYS